MTDPAATRILDAALPHVPFDGWSEATLRAAAQSAAVGTDLARALFPRGGLDLALAYHRQGDARMIAALADRDLGALRFRERVALAVRLRLEGADREAVRRAAALMALPQNAPEAARAVWATADSIWTALGDTSVDGNWYSKRAILAGVYSSVVLYWLGDDSDGAADTWAFLDRRIEDVMRFEQTKARIKASPVLNATLGLPLRVLEGLRKPQPPGPMPGTWQD
ncbi:MAG: COQ9 family protein [Rhodobacter sp.]|uniref:COQ9 family protein n=1 Tax=Pararhodobacter sp. TaxID=2127056 RepID=UPI001D3035EA|nr:COQ9 family protein [Pararhodobacter sp.]MCB1345126.1 COQ9 family protein [Paracoccaceae bacterium]MCC0072802.1 COQ9 family protein [Rhodobacter sp.]HPD90909.1 COQ9 family protein [Pararhodobacter sp.]